MASFWCLYCELWIYFTPCSSLSIVNFEQVNAGWVKAHDAAHETTFYVIATSALWNQVKILFQRLLFLFLEKIIQAVWCWKTNFYYYSSFAYLKLGIQLGAVRVSSVTKYEVSNIKRNELSKVTWRNTPKNARERCLKIVVRMMF